MGSALPWSVVVRAALDGRRQSDGFRHRTVVRPVDAVTVEVGGDRLVNFSSNDYLGLSRHPRVVAAAAGAVDGGGVGTGASALISGYTPAHQDVEAALAGWKQTESVVLLGSGFAANWAAVQTIAAAAGDRSVRFLVDKLCHASLVDAVRATGSFRVFPHNHTEKLARLLAESDPAQLQVVVTESVFSMDGDAADLPAIVGLKTKHQFLLLLDEAHASGVYGPTGAGLAEAMGISAAVDLSVVTLSKALGCVGGAICGSADWCDAVVNFGRPYIYSTSLPAPLAAAAAAAIEIARTDLPRRRRLANNIRYVRSRLEGFKLPAGDSPILPIILGDAATTIQAAEDLRRRGLLVLPVRPPTVPRGSSRLRVTLCSEHSRDQLDQLLDGLKAYRGASR